MEKSNIWKIPGVIFSVASIFFGNAAYDKMFNYYSPEYSTSLSKNAYVGGDAYNYIINSNYTTAMCVLTIGCLLLGLICFGIDVIQNTMISIHNAEKQPILNQNEPVKETTVELESET